MTYGNSLLLCVCVFWFTAVPCGVKGADEVSKESLAAEACDLVGQLGDDQFQRREFATERLIEMGTPAISAVEEGARSIDREVRYRSLRILSTLRLAERNRRISAFLQRQTSADEDALPGWSRLRDLLGDTDAVRQLYSQMFQRQWELLARLDLGDLGETSRRLALRTEQLQRSNQGRFAARRTTIDEGTFAALLLVALEDDLFVAERTVSRIWSFCRDLPVLRRLETGDPTPTPLRKLLGIWVQRRGGTFLGLSIAMRYGIDDALIPAERLLRDDTTQPHVRQYAILTVAKFGGRGQIPLLAKQLDNKSLLSRRRVANSKKEIMTQVRDVALVTLWLLVDEDPKDHGFPLFRPNSQIGFQPNSAGFQDESKRDVAIAEWHTFAAEQAK